MHAATPRDGERAQVVERAHAARRDDGDARRAPPARPSPPRSVRRACRRARRRCRGRPRAAASASARTRSTARTRVACVQPSTATNPSRASTATTTHPGCFAARARARSPGRCTAADPSTTRAAPSATVRREALARAHAAADLHPGPERLDDRAHGVALHGRARARSLEIDHVEQRHLAAPRRARAARGTRRTRSPRRSAPVAGAPPCRPSRSMAGMTITTRGTSRAARAPRAGSSPGETGRRRGCRARRRSRSGSP